MPRARPCRFLRNFALVWVAMIALWMFMPSWSVSPHDRDAYIRNALDRGNTVITVMEYDRKISKDVRSNMVSDSECTSLLLHWWLRPKAGSYVLSLSSTSAAGINLTYITEKANIAHQAHKQDSNDQSRWPYFSESVRLQDIAEGSLDEEINMPWFDEADQHLFHHEMHNFFTTVFLTGVVAEPGTVEICGSKYIHDTQELLAESLGSKYTHNIREVLSESRRQIPSKVTIGPQRVYEEMVLRQSATDMIASFKEVRDEHGTHFVVNEIKGRLASRSFSIRRRLLFFLGPLFSIAMIPISILAGLSDLVAPVFPFILVWLGIVFVLFLYRRLVAYGLISRTDPGDKKIWGPAGPVKAWSQFDEEKGVTLQRPKTVRLGKHWRD